MKSWLLVVMGKAMGAYRSKKVAKEYRDAMRARGYEAEVVRYDRWVMA